MKPEKNPDVLIAEASQPETPLGRLFQLMKNRSLLVRMNALKALIHRYSENERLVVDKLSNIFENSQNNLKVIGLMNERMILVYALYHINTEYSIERAKQLSRTLTKEEVLHVLWNVENNPW